MSPRLAARLALVRLGFLLGRLSGPPRPRVVLATSHARAISGNLAAPRGELPAGPPRSAVRTSAAAAKTTPRALAAAPLASMRAGSPLAGAGVFVVDDSSLP